MQGSTGEYRGVQVGIPGNTGEYIGIQAGENIGIPGNTGECIGIQGNTEEYRGLIQANTGKLIHKK